MSSGSKDQRRTNRRAPSGKARSKRRTTARPDATDSDVLNELGSTALLDAPRNLWRAGVEALSSGAAIANYPQVALQGGLKKLESVFDQRVLDALERVSLPSPQELRQLVGRVAALEKRVEQLSRRKPRE
jgi:hypothetical protein